MTTETLIVGGGLAGTTLALQMEECQKDYLVLDNNLSYSSSLVAAGLYNPVVFRKPSLSFNALNLIPYLKSFYEKWELKWGESFHQKRDIIKIFSSVEELNNWSVKSRDGKLSTFLSQDLLVPNFNLNLKCENGAGRALQAGNVYLDKYLDLARINLADRFIPGKALAINKSRTEFEVHTQNGSIKCHRVISCTGHLGSEAFNYLPLGDTKGDVLTIYCPDIEGSDIINKGFFIMPLGEGFHRVGATFEWENNSYLLSEKAREELEKKLKSVLKCNFKVEDQQSGKRPTVGDRRPLIGEHPEIKELYIFNGLGSKGVMLAPYYSHQLVKHIFEEAPLDSEVDIKRYLKHYGNS